MTFWESREGINSSCRIAWSCTAIDQSNCVFHCSYYVKDFSSCFHLVASTTLTTVSYNTFATVTTIWKPGITAQCFPSSSLRRAGNLSFPLLSCSSFQHSRYHILLTVMRLMTSAYSDRLWLLFIKPWVNIGEPIVFYEEYNSIKKYKSYLR